MSQGSRLERTALEIGKRLRAARSQAGMTLSELAGRAHLSEGFLSRLERGQASSSIANLLRITEVLGIGLHELFPAAGAEQRTAVSVHRASKGDMTVAGGGYRWRPLAGGAALDHMEVFHIALPRKRHSSAMFSHPGQEHCYVISGEVLFHVAGELHHLHAGDGILINSELPHRAESAGKGEAQVLMVVTKLPHAGAHVDWWQTPTSHAEAVAE